MSTSATPPMIPPKMTATKESMREMVTEFGDKYCAYLDLQNPEPIRVRAERAKTAHAALLSAIDAMIDDRESGVSRELITVERGFFTREDANVSRLAASEWRTRATEYRSSGDDLMAKNRFDLAEWADSLAGRIEKLLGSGNPEEGKS